MDFRSIIDAVRTEGTGGWSEVLAAMATPVTERSGVVARSEALRPVQVVSAQTATPVTAIGSGTTPINITYNITGVSSTGELEEILRSNNEELKRELPHILQAIEIDRHRSMYR
jgi:hypothetical protein